MPVEVLLEVVVLVEREEFSGVRKEIKFEATC